MAKVIIVLTILIASDILFNWGLPLGGLLFLLWLFLFDIYGQICKGELIEKGDPKPFDGFCVFSWWVFWGGVCLLGNPIKGTIIGILLMIVGGIMMMSMLERWTLAEDSLYRKKYYVNLVYALFIPLIIHFALQALKDLRDKED